MKKEKDTPKKEKLLLTDMKGFKEMDKNTPEETAIDLGDIPESDVEDLMSDEQASDTAVLKELFNKKNARVKSELSDYEIKIIARLEILAVLTNRPKIKEVCDHFIELRISKDRQSRKEFVEAHKEMKKDTGNNFLRGLMPQQ